MTSGRARLTTRDLEPNLDGPNAPTQPTMEGDAAYSSWTDDLDPEVSWYG